MGNCLSSFILDLMNNLYNSTKGCVSNKLQGVIMVQLLDLTKVIEEKKAQKLKFKRKSKPRKRLREVGKVEPREPVPIIEADTDLCFSIWQSVIVQAIYDIVGEGTGASRVEAKAEALAWFAQGVGEDGKQTDFELVCELAQMEPTLVMKCARLAKKQGVEALDGFNFRTLRKKTSSRPGKKT